MWCRPELGDRLFEGANGAALHPLNTIKCFTLCRFSEWTQFVWLLSSLSNTDVEQFEEILGDALWLLCQSRLSNGAVPGQKKEVPSETFRGCGATGCKFRPRDIDPI